MPKVSDFTPVPPGTYLGICYRILDLGTQPENFQGQEKMMHKILLNWEIPEEKTADGKAMMVGKKYTFSSGKNAHLRADLESWRAKAFSDEEIEKFDIQVLIGQPAMLTIVESTSKQGRTFSNVDTVSKIPKGIDVPKVTENPKQILILTPNEFNQQVYDGLSDNLKGMISRSPEFQELKGGKPRANSQVDPELDDEIPF
jgi:hypothetical protein